ncbi:alpha/beta hydrolase [Clavibacter michiganensis]|uniref:alpha/beta hydrolase n=1 Tax=Clavibacter michiganensis TaxID=28447 RepID=UPI0026DD9E2A|nr:alpha/beta hydrolase [Clavibacter michiganensis]MDO4055137.1 alpha/beta hydrolase [Clavibacter michiganensis]MDO4058035.1 alpha/beta hydrolase [Clavibacter michiganensis]MDO4061050.1 alpha/beta hydrolase [Clavibacter michiganensis]MDO4070528.1 alpha/beta hydrolase [Clavibacter michiganensis]MDO4073483.1 alpha/beta hydrolase [Clavibacter michiganensis]
MTIFRVEAGPRVRGTLVLLGTVAVLAVWLEFLIIRHHAIFGVVNILLGAILAVLAMQRGRRGGWLLLTLVGAVSAVLQLLWVTTSLYPLWIAAFIATLTLAACSWAVAWGSRRHVKLTGAARSRRWIARAGAFLGAGLATVVSLAFVVLAITPAPATESIQASTGFGNSFEAAAATETRVVNGSRLTNDIQYGTRYPNSFLDIYIADNDPSVARPTYVVVHGGGFIVGSKTNGDPNAAGGPPFAVGGGPVLDAGYNVVAIDYGLAPGVPYPTPVIQLGEAIDFLQEHGAEFGLDMSRVVLAGGSAGGHIVGQYANIQTNPDYAGEMGIAPTISPSRLEAVVLDSAALVPAKAGYTQEPSLANDFLFDLSLRSYVGTSQHQLAEANIILHAGPAFPPSFITDGNTATFADQAEELSTKLTELGVRNEVDLPPVSNAVLGHAFMYSPSPSTDEYNEKKIAFLADVLR